MKYEMIFGDEKLFDGAPDDCILVVTVPDKDKIFYLENNKSELKGSVLVMDEGFVKLAMRRIIKEPKRWTVADQKAGRLPEVGCSVYSEKDSESAVVIAKDHEGDIWFQLASGRVRCTYGYKILPIETPAEKAQREEDEFVSLVMSEHPEISSPISLKVGIRAAYRKLKGGE